MKKATVGQLPLFYICTHQCIYIHIYIYIHICIYGTKEFRVFIEKETYGRGTRGQGGRESGLRFFFMSNVKKKCRPRGVSWQERRGLYKKQKFFFLYLFAKSLVDEDERIFSSSAYQLPL